MKKILVFLMSLLTSSALLAGGLVTNTNQSAMFTRLQCRDATLGIDAVYYNPAGLARLNNGFYLSLNNQTINQSQTISNNYQFLTDPDFNYTGIVKAPFFPGFYAAYKTGKIAVSAGFNPIGGGGGAEFADGLPSFEMEIANLVPLMQAQLSVLDATIANMGIPNPGFSNISGYNSSIYFKGSSVYYGFQANVSYAVSDMVSMAIGARYVSAKNTYNGYIKDVTITAPTIHGGTQTPGDYLRYIAGLLPFSPDNIVVQTLRGTAGALDEQTNLEVDVEEKGSGITPIASLNFSSPGNRINLAVKYEFKTKLELATKVIDGKDAGGMFINDAAKVADMPAQLSVGASMRPMNRLLISTGIHYYFDKENDYDGDLNVNTDMIDKNSMEYALGLEFGISDKIRVSAGWLTTKTGVNDLYQSDRRFSLNTNSFGGGFGFSLLPSLEIDLGASFTVYQDGSKDYNYLLGTTSIPVTESYDKSVWLVSAGLSFSIQK